MRSANVSRPTRWASGTESRRALIDATQQERNPELIARDEMSRAMRNVGPRTDREANVDEARTS
jgi:hypothetical protein